MLDIVGCTQKKIRASELLYNVKNSINSAVWPQSCIEEEFEKLFGANLHQSA